MILYLLCGFIIGILLPYIARRFAKFMPATPAYAIWLLLYLSKHSKGYYQTKLFKKYFLRSVFSGVFCCLLTYVFIRNFGAVHIWWYFSFLWLVLLLAEIDWRLYLLPDILTVPLLILGFAAAAFNCGWVIPVDSAMGALFGYFMPIIVSVFMLKRSKDAFGGGDIKFLAALGAWVGLVPLLYVVALASILMLIYMLIKRKRYIAFGPALSLSAIMVAIYIF